MTLETLGLFVLTEFLLSITPGPAVLLILGLSMRHGFKIGFAATLGILTSNTIYFALVAFGIGAMILASATLFTIIKWAGAVYLGYLGVGMIMPLVKRIRSKKQGSPAQAIDVEEAVEKVAHSKESFKRSFVRGFALQAGNPKMIAFFVAILPQFISPTGNVAGQLLILGIVSVLLELPILVAYGFASSKSAALMKEHVIDWIEGIGGGLLISMGLALALYRRTSSN